MDSQLWLSPSDSANSASLKVWPDWYDYGQIVDGMPETHYRFQIQPSRGKATFDARAKTLEEAERIICEAFGWSH